MFKKVITLLFLITMSIGCEKESNEPSTPNPIDPIEDPNNPVNPIGEGTSLIFDSFEGTDMVLIGNNDKDFVMAFERDLTDGTRLAFEEVQDELPIVMTDEEGNMWDVFGHAISGPREGERLNTVTGYRGYWFAFGTFYPGTEIFGDGPIEVNVDPTLYEPTGEWGVPANAVLNGGPGQDGIPSIDDPDMTTIDKINVLSPTDLIVGVKIGNEVRGYPYPILDWHEIVNDQIGEEYFSVIYCPLTGTATVWNRVLDGQITTFGVSGLLYNTNVVPYDRETGSRWSQILHKGIEGENLNKSSEDLIVFETNWTTWQILYPDASILSTNTGFNRNYGNYPYGNYRINHDQLIFPITYDDNRLNRKERVYGVIINGKAKVYRSIDF